MVLIRLAYVADLPPPDEILEALGGNAPARSRPAGRAAITAPAAAGPTAEGGAATAALPAVAAPTAIAHAPSAVAEHLEAAPDDVESDEDASLDPDDAATPLPTLQSFADVVALVGARREAKLKYDLEERVSLVKFDPAGSIDLHLLPGVPKELPNELREKLNLWTGRRWVIALSTAPGERPLGELQREREAAELREIQSHPAVAAVLQQFPDAKVRLKPLPGSKR
jgi:DNA polymerase-3 subunit gamma/tau